MTDMNIPMDLPEYDLVEWGPVIQQWLDDNYGKDVHQLVCYPEEYSQKRIWPGEDVQIKSIRTINIAHYSSKKHFYPIENIRVFMGNNYFCPACEESFSTKEHHKSKCPLKCKKCARFTKKECDKIG